MKQFLSMIIGVFLLGSVSFISQEAGWTGEEPLGHWLFEESQRTESGIKNDAGPGDLLVKGGVRFRTEGERSAMIVDAEKHDARVPYVVGSSLLPPRTLSVEAWVAIERTVEWGGILSAARDMKGWSLGFRQSNFTFGVATEQDGKPEIAFSRAPDSLDWGRWYHVVGTYDGTVQCLYVDGLLEDSKSVSGDIVYPENPDIQFGTYNQDEIEFRSQIWFHETALYDRALSAEEVKNRFEKKKSIIPAVIHVKVGPYLERIDRDTLIARWETAVPCPSVLYYGQEIPVELRVEDLTPKTRHELAIHGIENQKMYSYRIEFLDSQGKTQSTRLHELDTTFDFAPVETKIDETAYPADDPSSVLVKAADDILKQAGIDRGYCVILGVGEGRLAFELAKRTNLKIVCLDRDAQRVQEARKRLDRAGLYGVRVSVLHVEGDSLNLAPYLANIVTSESLLKNEEVPFRFEEVSKIIRPNGGLAFLPKQWGDQPALKDRTDFVVDNEDPRWVRIERKPLEGAGAWTHQYGDAGNTSNSQDRLVTNPLEVLWYGEPGPRPMMDRGTRSPAPLSVNGRLFVQADRRLFGLDAYNGTILWEIEIPDLRRANLPRDCSNMLARGDYLFVAIRDLLWKIDGQTGELLATYPVESPNRETKYDWGYIADGGDFLLGSAVQHGGLYIGADGEWYDEPNQESEKVTSDNLYACDPDTGRVVWKYEKGRIINATLAGGDGSIYFIESRSPEALDFVSSRLPNDVLFKEQFMVALDAKTGAVRWEKPVEFEGGSWVFYLTYDDGVISVLATTKQFHLHNFSAEDGTPIWEHHNEMRRDHHGGAMQHPVLTRGNIYSDSLAFDLHTGKIVHDNLPERRGCGTMSAGADAIFFRHHFHSVWDLETDERVQYEGLRSGCWLGIIPAGGILLAPESSAGCYCADPIQTTIAFLPGEAQSKN